MTIVHPERFAAMRAVTLTVLLALAVGPVSSEAPVAVVVPDTGLDERQAIVHALNRLAYGPRPGDVAQVQAIGLAEWIEMQLDPDVIPDAKVERLLAPYETLTLDRVELLTEYTPPNVLRQMARRLEKPLGKDAVADIFPEVAARDRAKQATGDKDKRAARRKARPDNGGLRRVNMEMAQAKLVRAIESERQLYEVMTDFWFNHFNVYANKGADRWLIASYEREAIRPHALGSFRDLLGATARHPAMLFYLDNWVSSSAKADFGRVDLERYSIEAIRDQGMPPGGLATLILRERGMDTRAVERQFVTQETRVVQASQSKKYDMLRRMKLNDDDLPGRSGLNENYGRELLELHTLGVDGGYTQDDIVAVARCFTGWTLLPVKAGQGFVYIDELHDKGKKVVLGKKIKGKGMAEGEAVLDRLAAHPSTARFIAHKLAVRFVSDTPPEALVERVATSFMESEGDIRTVLVTLFSSPEFWSPDAVGAKVKTPFEFVASAARATELELAILPGTSAGPAGSRVAMSGTPERRLGAGMDEDSFASSTQPPGLLKVLRDLGQTPYAAEPPTGYKDTADAWVSTGALLNRMKVALGLAVNRIPGARTIVDVEPRAGETSEDYLHRLGETLLGQAPREGTLEAIMRQLELSPKQLAELGVPPRATGRSRDAQGRIAVGWMLASAEFQRR